jgi:hypothetical protein
LTAFLARFTIVCAVRVTRAATPVLFRRARVFPSSVPRDGLRLLDHRGGACAGSGCHCSQPLLPGGQRLACFVHWMGMLRL